MPALQRPKPIVHRPRATGAHTARPWHAPGLLLALLLVLAPLLPAGPLLAQEGSATPSGGVAQALEPTATAQTGAAPATAGVTVTSALTDAQTLTATQTITATPPLTAESELVTDTLPAAETAAAAAPGGASTSVRIEEILAGMSAADRVGQLFIVTFRGADTSFESAIAELIYAYRVGGVMLGAENGNFSNEPGANTARQVAELTNKLQGLAYGILLPSEQALQPVPNEPWPPGNLVSLEREIGVAPPNLPLLIGVEQLGDNLQGTALRRGFSPLPSQLAVGSTWDPETARLVGETAGRELRAVGINLLLGPILDVVDVPRSDEVGSLSVHSFGGNPSWVGRMGRAYIGGVHEGSSGRVATVSRHFPGQGDIDRLPDAEVATIQRTLAELEQIAIPPFLAVTRPQIAPAPDDAESISAAPAAAESVEPGDVDAAVVTATTGITSSDALSASVVVSGDDALTATVGVSVTPTGVPASTPPPAYVPLLNDPSVTDIVMTSHMRYAALQPAGGPVAPLGLSPELTPLLAEQLGGWVNSGGLVMSGPLGVPAIRRTYAPALDDFPARRIALDAFSAGNDLLYLSRFALTEDWEQQLDNYRAVIAFFQERYRADPDFAAQVDDAVRRILALKLRLYERTAPAPERPRMPAVPLSTLLVQEADLLLLPGAQAEAAIAAAAQDAAASQDAANADAQNPVTATTALTAGAQGGAQGDLQPGAASALGAAAGSSGAAATTAAVAAPATAAAAQTARKAVTMLFPDPEGAPPAPTPQAGEKIVIISDSRLQRECPTCTAEAAIDPDAIARIIISLYGPEATGQINPTDITSLTFSDLAQLLPAEVVAAPTGTPSLLPTATPLAALPESTQPPVSELLEEGAPAATEDEQKTATRLAEADWLIFALLDPNSAFAGSDALRRYLRLATDQLDDKQVVVFALNAPSFLDATEISKLTLYLGLYSKVEPFLESAVRALFRSFAPDGAPAVSVPGTRFASLDERLTADPALTLPLQIRNDAGLITANPAAAATAVDGALSAANEAGPAVVNVGDTVAVEAGPILDRNGRPVPDGTIVTILADFEGAELAMAIPPGLTVAGRAVREVALERGGVLRIAATAGTDGAATSGEPLILNVLEPQPVAASTDQAGNGEEAGSATTGAETAAPDADAGTVLTPSVVLSGTATGTTADAAEGAAANATTASGERVNLLTLLLSLLTMLVALSLLLLAQIRVLPRETLFKSLLWAVIVGLAAYVLYALGWLPGSDLIASALNAFGAPLVVFLAMLLPLFWLQLRTGADR